MPHGAGGDVFLRDFAAVSSDEQEFVFKHQDCGLRRDARGNKRFVQLTHWATPRITARGCGASADIPRRARKRIRPCSFFSGTQAPASIRLTTWTCPVELHPLKNSVISMFRRFASAYSFARNRT